MSINKHVKHSIDQALQYLDDSADAILNLNQLYIISTKRISKDGNCTLINMLIKAVKLKSPTVNDAFNYYLLSYSSLIVDTSTGELIYDSSKIIENHSPSFLGWLRTNQEAHRLFKNIDYGRLDRALINYNITTMMRKASNKSLPKNIIQYRSEYCPGCGKKFRIGSADIIDNHTCKTVNTAKSIRTLSGGGGPGTGKRS